MDNNKFPRAQYNAMRKALRTTKDSSTKIMVERADSARRKKVRRRNVRKRMSPQQKRAAQGKR